MKEKIVTSEIKKSLNQAVDQLPQPSFEKIANMPVVKMDRMDAITSQEKPKSSWFSQFCSPVSVRRIAAVCGCLLLFLAAGGIYSYENIAVDSVVDIDINPCFELEINRKDKVLTFSPLNQDAVEAAEGRTYKGWKVEDAVKDLRRIMEEKEYLTDEKRSVLISVENKDPDRVSELQTLLSDCFQKTDTEKKRPVHVVTQERKKDRGIIETARDYNISPGKLQFIRTMTASYPELDEKTLANMTMEELYGIIFQREMEKPDWIQMDDEDWKEYREDLDDDSDDDDDRKNDDLDEDEDSGETDDERDDDRDDDDRDDDDDDREVGKKSGKRDRDDSDERDTDDDRDDDHDDPDVHDTDDDRDSDDDRSDSDDRDSDSDHNDSDDSDDDDDRDDRDDPDDGDNDEDTDDDHDSDTDDSDDEE